MALFQEFPAPRVGQLLSAARHRHDRSEQDVAIAVGVPLRMVRRWEQGLEVPTVDQVERLAALYGESTEQLLPARDVAVLDTANGTLTVGTATVDVEGEDNEGLLERYVSLVRSQRHLSDDAVIDLRDEDIGALASVLDLTDGVLHRRLERIVGLTAAEAAEVAHKMRRWRYLAPVAGLAVGALALFGVTQAFGGKGSSETPSAPTVNTTQTGTPAAEVVAPTRSTVTVPAVTVPAVTVPAVTAAPSASVAAPNTAASPSSPTSRGRTAPVATTRSLAPNIGNPVQVSPSAPPPTNAPTTVPGAVAVPGENNDPSVTTPSTDPPESTTTVGVDIGDGGAQVTAP